MKTNKQWFDYECGFFGEFYQKGDNSKTGYLSKNQTQKQRTKEEVEGVIRLLEIGKGSSICDFPCGIGRHSIELAKRGYHVRAIDSNPAQLQTGLNKMIRQKKMNKSFLYFHHGDMASLNDLGDRIGIGSFDAVINMFFSFGYFETDEENKKVAEGFFGLLKPGGKFLMHTDVNMARVRHGKYKFKETRRLMNGGSLEIMEKYNSRTRRIEGIWAIGDGGNICNAKGYSVRVYENEEFVDLCRGVGFKNVKIYSDWKGSPYHEDAEMVIFVAEK